MGRILVVAEKPSVGADIARVLKCTQRGEGFRQGETHVVTWALGHLVGLAEPENLDPKYKRWTLEALPMLPQDIPLKVLPKTKKQFGVVKKWMNASEIDSIICATDAGREGELIFRWIYEMAGCKKPVQRLWISSMTDAAIKQGFADIQGAQRYDNLYISARARARADWLVGMNATRAYTVRYNALLSIGRVQTPTLQFIVARQKEIDAFTPQPYWVITADFGDYKGLWEDPSSGALRAGSEALARQVVARVRGRQGRIGQVQRDQKSQGAPLLYDLTELQRDCNRMFGFTAKKTLSVAQALYERRKLITYPRTDSRYLTGDMVGKLKPALARMGVPALSPFAAPLLALDKLPVSGRIVNDKRVSDHHAIIPTGRACDFAALSPDEQKVYDRICRRFVAVFYPAWEYEDVRVTTRVDVDAFITKGRITRQLGWKALYPKSAEAKAGKKQDDEPAETLPAVSEGETRKVEKVSSQKKETKPPAPYTEATLLSAMEHAGRMIEDEALREQMKDSGLGTPATRAAIIERLIDTEYIKRRGKALVPTQKGVDLIGILPEEMRSPELTGKWEQSLSKMARGQMQEEPFAQSIRRFVQFIVLHAKEDPQTVRFERSAKTKGRRGASAPGLALGACPLCGQGEIRENAKAYYCTRWREGCKFTWWKDGLRRLGGPMLTAKHVEALLKEGRLAGRTGTIVVRADHTLTFEKKAPAAKDD